MILQNPIETCKHGRKTARAGAIKNAYWNESHGLCYAVIRSANDARYMRQGYRPLEQVTLANGHRITTMWRDLA